MLGSNDGFNDLQAAVDSLLTGGDNDLFDLISDQIDAGAVAVPGGNSNEVQVVTVDATGGTFTLTFDGQTTAAIAYNASAATMVTRLEALSNIGSGDVAVSGSNGGPWTITFQGALAGDNVALLTANAGSLTGGASTATISLSTQGSEGALEDVLRAAGITSADYAVLQAREHLNPSELPVMFALAAAADITIALSPTANS